jgi:tetratricopeptide (TPR) repeat protein
LCNCLDGLTHNAYQLQEFEHATGFANRSLALTAESAINERIARLQNLAAIENGMGNAELAITLGEKALELASQVYGKAHPIVAQAEGNVGHFKHAIGKFEESLIHFFRVIDYFDTSFGKNYERRLVILNGISVSLIQLKRLEEGAAYCNAALDLAEAIYGPDHINTITAGVTYAYCLLLSERLESAHELYTKWLPRKQVALGKDHPSCLRTAEAFNALELRLNKQKGKST